MRDSSSADSIQTPIGYGTAGVPNALVPDVPDPSDQAREIKQAMRDPKFALSVHKKLVDQVLIGVIALACFLLLFFFIGLLALH